MRMTSGLRGAGLGSREMDYLSSHAGVQLQREKDEEERSLIANIVRGAPNSLSREMDYQATLACSSTFLAEAAMR